MRYIIRHITQFRYNTPVFESMMEVRMQPRTEGIQRCHGFDLAVSPEANITSYRDHLDNTVHVFDIPGQHTHLTITGTANVSVDRSAPLPDSLPAESWAAIDRLIAEADHWEMLMPGMYARPTRLLDKLAGELAVRRRDDPLTVLRDLNAALYRAFEYQQATTRVDSPIDDALRRHAGVCQDFTHIMIALLRFHLHIPCRYVSGYLFHRRASKDRSEDDASHAWVEALLPGLGWVGFDPTNNLIPADRHIRVAIGSDYSAAPPTRGLYKGDGRSELGVSVRVQAVDGSIDGSEAEEPPSITFLPLPPLPQDKEALASDQQQQQQ